MNREEVIKLSDELLRLVPDVRNRIKLIDMLLKKDSYDISNVEKLNQERRRLNRNLYKVIKAMSNLNDETQRIICYKYFDKLSYKQISIRTALSYSTIVRRINKGSLTIGRIMFGFEDEFWREISNYNTY